MHNNVAKYGIIAFILCISITILVLVIVTLSKEKFEDNFSTIFISIPSYRDADCKNTINDIYKQAKYPKRIFIGVCEVYGLR